MESESIDVEQSSLHSTAHLATASCMPPHPDGNMRWLRCLRALRTPGRPLHTPGVVLGWSGRAIRAGLFWLRGLSVVNWIGKQRIMTWSSTWTYIPCLAGNMHQCTVDFIHSFSMSLIHRRGSETLVASNHRLGVLIEAESATKYLYS